MTYGSRHISDYPTTELRSMEPGLICVPPGTFFPRDHLDKYIELVRVKVTDDDS